MAERDRLLRGIEAVHSAGLDQTLWPQALAATRHTVGGVAATLEIFDRRTSGLIEFQAFGLPPANEIAYLDHYSALNPRIPALINGKPGGLVTDYMVLDERSMNRDPFYAGLLAPAGYRYFVGATLDMSDRKASLFSVQRTKKQEHVGRNEMTLMRLLAPHVRQALATTIRLRNADRMASALRDTLDRLADGVVLLQADGTVTYVNQAMQAIARRDDGIRIEKNRVAFKAIEVHGGFELALGCIARLHASDLPPSETTDFPVARKSGEPAYIVSIRPLARRMRQHDLQTEAIAIAFVRDPLKRNAAAIRLQRELFGFTEAEAGLAQALQAGISPDRYARARALSFNTVYTHLRRIKGKTGCSRLPELIRKLNEVQVPIEIE